MSYRFYAHGDLLQGDAEISEPVGMLDFWRWAFSDLLEDTLKGLFAEWMVGHLLALPMPSGGRPGYGNFDLTSLGGLRIEVKSSAFWQSWKLRDQLGVPKPEPDGGWKPVPEDSIRFGGLRAADAVDRANAQSGYKADVYVFCFQRETDPKRWDALNLDQWEFYFLSREELEQLGVATLSLKKLRIACGPLSARNFQLVAKRRIAELERVHALA
jgi:hypothetical protein